jgi:hypothetical protein
VEHLAVPGRRGGVGQDGGGDGRDLLVDEERLGTVDQEETGDTSGGELATERLRLQGLASARRGRGASSPRTQGGGGRKRMPHTPRTADDRGRRDAKLIGHGARSPRRRS